MTALAHQYSVGGFGTAATTSHGLFSEDFEPTALPAISGRYVVQTARSWIYPHAAPRSYFDAPESVVIRGAIQPAARATVVAAAKLAGLPKNWDGYGAPKIDVLTIEAAMQFANSRFPTGVPSPAVVPTSSGGVQLEWHERGVDLEIEFDSPFAVHWLWEDHRTGEVREGSGASTSSELASLLRNLTDR